MNVLCFTVHPARTRPFRSFAVLLFIGLAAWTLGAGLLAPLLHFGPTWAALAVGGVLLAQVHPWFLPTRWRFDENGFERACLTRRRYAWSQFRSYQAERGGCYVSPRANPQHFDRYRGVFVFVGGFVTASSPCAPSDTQRALCDLLARRFTPRSDESAAHVA